MSCHYNKILKRVVNRLWDTLSNRERDIIAADVGQETELAQWFNKTAVAEAKAKFESPTYWMNEQFSFYYPASEADLNASRMEAVLMPLVAPVVVPAKVSKRARNKARKELVAA